mgnify:CR=1 FL=1
MIVRIKGGAVTTHGLITSQQVDMTLLAGKECHVVTTNIGLCDLRSSHDGCALVSNRQAVCNLIYKQI